MSMWELEALAEDSVRLIGASDLPVAQKRNLMASAYDMVEGFDVSFIHFRTPKILADAQFFFRIDLEDHPDYADKKDDFEAIRAAGKSQWLDGGAYYQAKSLEHASPGVWFDARSDFWQTAVDAGLVTGAGAEPLEPLETIPTIVALLELALAEPNANAHVIKILHGFAAWPLGEELTAGDERLAAIRSNPGLAQALDADHEDWVMERFDAEAFMEWVETDEEREFLEWWAG